MMFAGVVHHQVFECFELAAAEDRFPIIAASPVVPKGVGAGLAPEGLKIWLGLHRVFLPISGIDLPSMMTASGGGTIPPSRGCTWLPSEGTFCSIFVVFSFFCVSLFGNS
jgi:hypothetical protein